MAFHILVSLDGGPKAKGVLPYAAALGLALKAQITLLRVLESTPVYAQFVDPLDWQISKTEADVELDQAVSRFEAMGLQVTKALLESATPERMIEYANTHAVDLIVLGKEGSPISSTIHTFLMHSQVPTLLIPLQDSSLNSATPPQYRKMLVPLDGSRRAECALPLAMTFARACEAQLILAHVVRVPEMPRRVPLMPKEIELTESLTERNRAEAEVYLEQTKSRVSDQAETRLLVNQNVPQTLHQLADQENVDLIILCAHGYSGQPERPFGSLTNDFIVYSKKPILIVQDLPCMQNVSVHSEAFPREIQGR